MSNKDLNYFFSKEVSGFKIRKATPTDAHAISEVHAIAWRSTYKSIIHSAYLEKITPELRYKSAVKRLLRDDLLCFVILDNVTGKIVGFADFGPNRDTHFEADCELYAIYIYEEFQGRGGGQLLFEIGMNALLKKDFKKMLIVVLEKNIFAKSFYEKMGAKWTGAKFIDVDHVKYPADLYTIDL